MPASDTKACFHGRRKPELKAAHLSRHSRAMDLRQTNLMESVVKVSVARMLAGKPWSYHHVLTLSPVFVSPTRRLR